jgi:predicted permease
MPDWKKIVGERLQPLGMAAAAEMSLAEEMAQHLEDRYREWISGGAGADEAYRRVLDELEDMRPVQASLSEPDRAPRHDPARAGDARPGGHLAGVWRDLRYAARSMRRSPIFVWFVVLTLALGIGANTTVFTMINTLLLNPLPVRDISQLTSVAAVEAANIAKTAATFPISYADLQDYRERNEVFSSLAGYTSPRVLTALENGVAVRIFGELVTDNYFSTLGLTPAKGRFFLPEENLPGANGAAVLNYGTWQTRFGGRDDIVGRTLVINHLAFTVVGVAPQGFIGVNAIFGPEVWVTAAMLDRLLPDQLESALTDRAKTILTGVGRLKPGATRAQAQANLAAIAAALAREYPAADEGHTASVRPVREAIFGSSAGSSSQMVFAAAALSIVVGIVLLIACANVANLLLARSAARRRELAVRLAMGASRRRLVRQLLTESVLLGLLGGGAGVFLGFAGLQLLFGTLPGAATFVTPKLDGTVLAFTLALSVATGLLFGAIPALKAARANVSDALKEEARTTGGSRRRVSLAGALMVGQVGLSFLLLVTATLFLRSIGRAYAMDPGFQTAHLAIFMTDPGGAGYDQPQTKAYYQSARQRVAGMAGVESVSWASNLPLWARAVSGLEIEGRQQRSRADQVRAVVNTVDLDYFATAGVGLASGRGFTGADQETTTPVAIVNQAMARDYWGGSALGRRIRLPAEKQMRVIVGVARTANYTTWGEAPQACIYVPLPQSFVSAMTLYVRSRRDPQEILVPVTREVRALAPAIPVSDVRTGSQIVEGGLFQAKVGVGMLTVFGLLALGLASIGLYGILAYSVNQRRREIGLRMALGASRAAVLAMVLKQGMSLVLAGVLLGLGAALAVGRLLSRMLYGVSATDPASVVLAALVLSGVALAACYLPARWATRVDPLTALRQS